MGSDAGILRTTLWELSWNIKTPQVNEWQRHETICVTVASENKNELLFFYEVAGSFSCKNKLVSPSVGYLWFPAHRMANGGCGSYTFFNSLKEYWAWAMCSNMPVAWDGFIFTSIAFPSSLFPILAIGFLWIGLEIPEDVDLVFLYPTQKHFIGRTKIHKVGQKLILFSLYRCENYRAMRLNDLPRFTHIGNDWTNAWILIFWLPPSTLSYTHHHLLH